jgi:hypothetical protein
MDPAREFMKHAAECRRMAQATRDRDSKATWASMAARWKQLAETSPHAPRRPPDPEIESEPHDPPAPAPRAASRRSRTKH